MGLKRINELYLFNIIFFITGIWLPKFGIPIIFIFLLYLIKKYKIVITKSIFFQYILIVLFILSYLLFWDDPSIPVDASYFKDKEFFMLFQLLIILSSVFWIPMFITKKEQILSLLNFFALGMFFKSLFYTLFTLVNAPHLLSLRMILDPFSLKSANSPAISLMAVYAVLIVIYKIFAGTTSKFYYLFNLFIICSGLFIAFLLQARTFFIITLVFVFCLAFTNLFIKKSIKMLVVLTLVSILLLFINNYLIDNNIIYRQTFENTMLRFEEEGTDSSRYLLWENAVNIIMKNPFGGGSTDKQDVSTYWFHNLWLDIGRTSGIIPVLIIILFQLRVFHRLIRNLFINKNLDVYFLFFFYVSLLIGQFVEISLEGNIVLFVFFIFYHSLVLKYQQLERKSIYGCKC